MRNGERRERRRRNDKEAGGGGGPGKEGYSPDAVVSIRPLEISSGL